MKAWYCVIGAEAKGPFEQGVLRQMIEEETISLSTLVWNDSPEFAGRGWVKASDTELLMLFPPIPLNYIPPVDPELLRPRFVERAIEETPVSEKRRVGSRPFLVLVTVMLTWFILMFLKDTDTIVGRVLTDASDVLAEIIPDWLVGVSSSVQGLLRRILPK
jgi:hypothetical protein